MKRNIYICLIILSVGILSSCSDIDFLDQNPNPAGNRPISSLKDLDLLLNNPDRVYGPSYIGGFGNVMSDDYGPNLDIYDSYKLFQPFISTVQISLGNTKEMENSSQGFAACFKSMFVFNTVINRINEFEGDSNTKKRLEAEARTLRAYFHFTALVEYAEWDESKPGLGYIDQISEQATHNRETVGYTLSKIREDIDVAERLFKESGNTDFNVEHNFRMSYPSLMSFKARFLLYRGEYDEALNAADEALKGYHQLFDLTAAKLTTAVAPGWPDGVPEIKLLEDYRSSQLYRKRVGVFIPITVWSSTMLLPSRELFDSYDNEDLRKETYFNNKLALLPAFVIKPNTSKFNDPYYMAAFYQQGGALMGGETFIGPSVAEMMLIKAECLARAGKNADAKNVLLSLRDTRFANKQKVAVDNGILISGSVINVLNERRREMPFYMRWYDLKRLNALNADPRYGDGIFILRDMHEDAQSDLPIKTYRIAPNAPIYALPLPADEIYSLGWAQNEIGGITILDKN